MLNKKIISGLTLLGAALSLPALAGPASHIAVANRAEGSVTLAGLTSRGSGLTFQPDRVYDRATLGFEIEPMYVSLLPITDLGGGEERLVAVGDRKNNQVIVLAGKGGQLMEKIPVGNGVFHQSARKDTLVVATDIQKGFNIIQATRGLSKVHFINRRFELPARFASGKPHDIVGSDRFVYLTVLGVQEDGKKVDYVLQVDATTLELKGARKFAFELHLLDLGSNFALVEQESGLIRIIDSATFKDLSVAQGPVGVHGVASGVTELNGRSENVLYVTDIDARPGETSVIAYTISDSGRLQKIAEGSTPLPTAHNIAVSSGALFVTHSGAQSKAVSVLELDASRGLLRTVRTFETGLNPFGIAGLEF